MNTAYELGIVSRVRVVQGLCGRGLHPKTGRSRCSECLRTRALRYYYVRRLADYFAAKL